MTFLNWSILFGLAAVAIPIIIHLLNRRRAKTVEWGAMRFLLASLASRNRRIMLEEMILMALRCLAVALVVLAMARPFLPAQSAIPWPLVVPAILVAAMCIGVAAAMWSRRIVRWALLGLAAGLLLLAGVMAAAEQWAQARRWTGGDDAKDIAVVIDGSTSMKLAVDGKTNFARAVEEARALAQVRRPGDAVALLVAAAVPRPVLPGPVSDGKEIAAALDSLQPPGGSLQVLEALNAAASALAQGHNPGKKIVLFTDGQDIGWDLRSEARWRFLGAALNNLPSRPQVICRRLAMPETFRNAAIADVTFSRKLIGSDRPVDVDVKVMNTGTVALSGLSVELSVDGVSVASEKVGDLAPNAAETINFPYRFPRPGPRVVTARILAPDELDDNVAHRVVYVIDKLRVLIVDGSSALRPLEGSAFIEVALAPPSDKELEALEGNVRPRRKRDEIVGRLVEPRVVPAESIASITGLSEYSVIILADVPKLPGKLAESLAAFVAGGGGLLIAPGERANLVASGERSQAPFYNEWTNPAGEPVIPARLAARQSVAQNPARLAVRTFSHPALELVADENRSDAASALVTGYWSLEADEKNPDVRVMARLDSGEPFLIERKLGKGYVIVSAVSFDRRDGNLPSLHCFVPLLHELTYYLAEPRTPAGNVECGAEATAELPRRPAPAGGEAPSPEPAADLAQTNLLDVETPDGRHRPGMILGAGETLRLRFDGADEPGLYRFHLPIRLASLYAPAAAEGNTVPFAAVSPAAESLLVRLPDSALSGVARMVEIVPAGTMEEMTAMVSGAVPGEEMWRVLAGGALLALLAEIFLARWIAVQRRSHVIQPVAFATEAVDIEAFRSRARELLASGQKPG